MNSKRFPVLNFPEYSFKLSKAQEDIFVWDDIRKKKFKIVIDAVNGAGSDALPALLESLGCEVVELNCQPSGVFNRGTEPLPENLTDLSNAVIQNNADAGFAVDPDADRLAVVDENGKPLGEEYTLVLAADGYMKNVKIVELD